jgi:hypothetical protein
VRLARLCMATMPLSFGTPDLAGGHFQPLIF